MFRQFQIGGLGWHWTSASSPRLSSPKSVEPRGFRPASVSPRGQCGDGTGGPELPPVAPTIVESLRRTARNTHGLVAEDRRLV